MFRLRVLRPGLSIVRRITTSSASSSTKTGINKWSRRLLYTTAIVLTFEVYDYNANASAFTRNIRAIYEMSAIALDYKLHFDDKHDIEALHARVADRVFELIRKNGGLYVKIGQAIAMQTQVLPPVFQEKFAQLFDMAPQDPWDVVEKLFVREFGRAPDDVFEWIDHKAVASASIAQVHRARLKSTGEDVAVKIQHADIEKQVYWDLAAYRFMMGVYDWYFDIPVYFTAQYITQRMQTEVVFENEAMNARNMQEKLQAERSLAGKVYIPKIYDEYTSKRVLVLEWIDGVSMNDRAEIERRGYSKRWIMDTMVNLFAAQFFAWGIVHCDPHPGNLIVRRRPGREKELQLVLIDHGLYIYEPPKFRAEYCTLWRYMFTFNDTGIRNIALQWGIGQPDIFASMTMLRPYRSKASDTENEKAHSDFDQQQKMKERFRTFIKDTTKMPLELIFLGRSIRIVQGCNQLFGSPVNRIKIFANWASRSLATEPGLSLSARVREWSRHLVFRFVVGVSDVTFLLARMQQVIFGRKAGFEDVLEQQMRNIAKSRLGIEIKEGVFEG
ncbi:ABC1 family-domain-containing protein [Kockiozyma suomiensis]|uniref:ABC1 family-domain-containing protein n=1 Tax=Kockiozyma suomiensis TaxID=1337062 RepID=UPI0033440D63